MDDTHRFTFSESLIVFFLLASLAAFLQLWIISGVGRFRLLGWFTIVGATYLVQYLVLQISSFVNLEGLRHSDYLIFLVPLLGIGAPWIVLPWRHFRTDN